MNVLSSAQRFRDQIYWQLCEQLCEQLYVQTSDQPRGQLYDQLHPLDSQLSKNLLHSLPTQASINE
jgi:hypothetical protein